MELELQKQILGKVQVVVSVIISRTHESIKSPLLSKISANDTRLLGWEYVEIRAIHNRVHTIVFPVPCQLQSGAKSSCKLTVSKYSPLARMGKTVGNEGRFPGIAFVLHLQYFCCGRGLCILWHEFRGSPSAGPLNRAEWIKFLGVFFNLDSTATQIFNSVNTSYYATKASVTPNATRPVMAFVDLYSYPPDTAYEVSLAAYKVQFTQVQLLPGCPVGSDFRNFYPF